MFNCLATHAPRLRVLIKTLLHGFEYVFVFPSYDPAFGITGLAKPDARPHSALIPNSLMSGHPPAEPERFAQEGRAQAARGSGIGPVGSWEYGSRIDREVQALFA